MVECESYSSQFSGAISLSILTYVDENSVDPDRDLHLFLKRLYNFEKLITQHANKVEYGTCYDCYSFQCPCADPESFVRGCPILTFSFELMRGGRIRIAI